ncbi:Rrf2 family transcriptional regulator [Acidaminobacter sp. JC074]|uniref:RrF2 family transcriptional regulator n=1 Tax=Acidaminobacter sp. JC074 TaxID=2530199 RepID=UPI001F0DA6CD|nr:Rrf2 family transcriptional regulator [Acidaminobacter sp. JC074]MCH4888764.1 Rrf2 family transcriptional regulator [Acidaminobacter sp. JC074]
MRITVESGCAVRIILFLSLRGVGEKTGAKMISENENIPIRFTLKILRKLKIAGLVCSFRGQSGGYALLKEPEDISLKEVIEVIDGPIVMNKCLGDSGLCDLERTSVCPVHYYLGGVQRDVSDKLGAINFKMLIDKYAENQGDIVTQIQGLK